MQQPVPRGVSLRVSVLALALAAAPHAGAGQTVEWTAYAADHAGTKYLPLDQINAETVADLEIVWR